MASFSAEDTETALENVEIVRKVIKRKFLALHIALDERESELVHELDQVRSDITGALGQWKKSMEDVQHTITHASLEIRDNSWAAKLDKEAKEELEILKSSKPKFRIEFSLSNEFEETISSVGNVYAEEFNARNKKLKKMCSAPTPKLRVEDRCELSHLKIEERCEFPNIILSESPEKESQLFRYRADLMAPVDPREKPLYYPSEQIIRPHTYMVKSLSCADLMTDVDRKDKLSCPQAKAFDDSCIKEEDIMDERNRFLTFQGKKNKSKEARKFTLSRKRTKTGVNIGATFKLSEVKIKKYLAHEVSLISRWNEKEVRGILRAIIPGESRVPIVGVELETNDGNSDGMYLGVQYFKTEKYKAYFLKADKVKVNI